MKTMIIAVGLQNRIPERRITTVEQEGIEIKAESRAFAHPKYINCAKIDPQGAQIAPPNGPESPFRAS